MRSGSLISSLASECGERVTMVGGRGRALGRLPGGTTPVAHQRDRSSASPRHLAGCHRGRPHRVGDRCAHSGKVHELHTAYRRWKGLSGTAGPETAHGGDHGRANHSPRGEGPLLRYLYVADVRSEERRVRKEGKSREAAEREEKDVRS